MNLFDTVINYLKGNQDKIEAPEGVCPNCWGRQEYEGKLIEAISHEHIDLNNVTEKKGWIQAYATQHLTGIKLEKKENVYECQTCKVTYKVS